MGRVGGVAARLCVGLLGLAACAAPVAPVADGLARPGAIFDATARRFVSEDEALARLAAARFVILGERHDHPEHHALQARLVRGLAAAGPPRALAFEMLPVDVADALAAAQAEPGADAERVRRAVAWDASGWPEFALYAPVFEAGLAAGWPLAAADLSRAALAALREGGLEALDPALRAELRLDAPSPEPLRAAQAADIQAGHCGHLPERALPRMVDTQLARDAQLARALEAAATPAGAVLVAGAGHARRDAGVPFWLARRAPGARVASVGFVEQRAPAPPGDEAARFDLVWYSQPLDDVDPCERFREQLEEMGERR
jgi:uncharacterized iron-regulated protein